MNRNRLLLAACIVIVLFVAGATSASALWQAQSTATSSVRAISLDDACVDVTAVKNASFESPDISTLPGNPTITDPADSTVEGWSSTPEHRIEIWRNGNSYNVAAPVGNQFIELNANVPGTLSQSIKTVSGQVVQWSLLHRGRAGTDVMRVLIGPTGGAAGTQISQGDISDDASAWKRYSGIYVVPSGQTDTQLSFQAVSTASNQASVGNFLDDVSFGSGPCLDVSSAVTKWPVTADPTIRAGDTVEYSTVVKNIGSSPSYETVFTNSVPAGLTYQAGSVRIGATLAAARVAPALTDGNAAADVGKVENSKDITTNLGTAATNVVGGNIAQGDQVVLRFLALAPTTTPNGTLFDYTPTLKYVNNITPDWTKTYVVPNAPMVVQNGSDLTVTASSPATVIPTASATYSFTVTNLGNTAALASKLTLQLSNNMVYTPAASSATPTPAINCVATTVGAQDCTIGTLAAAASRTFTFSRTAPATTANNTVHKVDAAVSTTSLDFDNSNNTASTSTVIADNTAPTAPGRPSTTGTNTATQITFTYTSSTDNVAVTGYNIYRGGVLVATLPASAVSFADNGLLPSTNYIYTIRAFDAAGNLSDASDARTRTTTAFTTATNYHVTGSNGLCMTISSNNTNTPINQNTCNTALTTQDWQISGTNGTLTVSARNSNTRDLTINNVAARTASLVTGVANLQTQQWTVEQDNVAGSFRLIVQDGDRCLTTQEANNTQLFASACTGAPNQSFTIRP